MSKVTPIKEEKSTQIFSFEVVMMVHIVSDTEKDATEQLNEKGGIVTKREVKLLNSTKLYGEKE